MKQVGTFLYCDCTYYKQLLLGSFNGLRTWWSRVDDKVKERKREEERKKDRDLSSDGARVLY